MQKIMGQLQQVPQGNTYLKDDTTTQYAVSKQIETINSQGGKLEKMSIGIFINDNLTEEEKNNITGCCFSCFRDNG